ncbi:XV phospholipase A2 [Seminavis robusta]|uniref:XV phospholipase A2 n=1 Tax=Seminavis robusta TaxID=568900 RepID=A0A9N8DLX4_9STRA|nr:XV phospholipase A2 [Seminavis robusta]|eukprot:Sro230_g093300.1 XV phospholipase A2 (871) ;mRNA; r:36073-38958
MVHPKEFLRHQESDVHDGGQSSGKLQQYERQHTDAVNLIQSLWRQKNHPLEEKRDWILLPVLIIPGIASSGLVIEHSGLDNTKHAGQRVWMNAAFLASSRLEKGIINAAEILQANAFRKQQSEEAEDFSRAEEAYQIRSAWLHHMSLSDNMVDERPGNKVRAYNGLEGIEYLSDDSVTQVGSWVHAPVTKYLVEEMGYTKGKNLDGAPYDWRLPPKVSEERDGYLTKTIQRIEEMYDANDGLPVVLICHSMGCKMGHYFLNFCLQQKGQAWIDKYIHTYMPVGAPHAGVSLAVRAGVTGQGLNDQVDMLLEGDDEGLVLYRSWGSGAWLMPRILPTHVVPSCIVRREGELGLKIVSSIQVGPLFANRDKPPKDLRLTVIFRDSIRAHTNFAKVVYKRTAAGGVDATVSFNETFYIAVPHLDDHEHLGELNIYLEEPAGRLHQYGSDFRQQMRQWTSWSPIRNVKKKISEWLREMSKRWGSVLRVAVCETPLRFKTSQFRSSRAGDDQLVELVKEVSMCGCVGNDDTSEARAIEYSNDDIDEQTEEDDCLCGTSVRIKQGGNTHSDRDIHTQPRSDQPLGTLHVKVRYRPPPKPLMDRDTATPVAATTPGSTPCIPIQDKYKKLNPTINKANFEVWDGHDLLKFDGFCGPSFNCLQEYYEADPLGPTTKSSGEAPPVKRVRAIYGINLPTEVCAVYRHRPVVVVGDDLADSRYVLDTHAAFPPDGDESVENNPWAKHNLKDYQMRNGRIMETKSTLQNVPGRVEQRRCCGDGTVPYWNLIHCLSWTGQVPDLTIDELKGAEHRGILADARFHALLKQYCKVRDPRATALLHSKQQHLSRMRQSTTPGAGGIGSLQSALADMSDSLEVLPSA